MVEVRTGGLMKSGPSTLIRPPAGKRNEMEEAKNTAINESTRIVIISKKTFFADKMKQIDQFISKPRNRLMQFYHYVVLPSFYY